MTLTESRTSPAEARCVGDSSITDAATVPGNWSSARGVSIVETVIVLAVLIILASAVVFQFTQTREAYNADDAANKLVNYFREANSRAVSDHHSFRVVINLNSGNISMIDEQTSATG